MTKSREEFHATNLKAHDWLLQQPHGPERDHIEELLAEAVSLKFDGPLMKSTALTPQERIVTARVVGYYLRKRVRHHHKKVQKGKQFIPAPGKTDVDLRTMEGLSIIQQKLLSSPLIDAEVEKEVEKFMGQDDPS